MTRLEDLTPNAAVRGMLPDWMVVVISAKWFGPDALELTYKDPAGRPGGVDTKTVRDVTENARSMKFKDHGFTKE